jgi:hypothetical protein
MSVQASTRQVIANNLGPAQYDFSCACLCVTAVSGSCKRTLYGRRQDFGAAAMMTRRRRAAIPEAKSSLGKKTERRAHVQQSVVSCWLNATRRTLPIGLRSVHRNQRKTPQQEKKTREARHMAAAAIGTTRDVNRANRMHYHMQPTTTAPNRPFCLCHRVKSRSLLSVSKRHHPCPCHHGCTCSRTG